MRPGLLPGQKAFLSLATAPWLALCSSTLQYPLAPCLQLWSDTSPSSPTKRAPHPIYHLTGLPPVGWLVTTQLWVTTFSGSGAVTLSASKEWHWPPGSHILCLTWSNLCIYATAGGWDSSRVSVIPPLLRALSPEAYLLFKSGHLLTACVKR